VIGVLAIVSLFAATVTGALGYGYSSITVPFALLLVASKTLNPAIVLVEVGVNSYAAVLNRRAMRAIWLRVAFVVIGILPGVVLGSLLLSRLDSHTAKVIAYSALLPLILLQAAGLRFPLRESRLIGLPFGMGIGTLYSLTTISGPPLALFFNDRGLNKEEFRVALAMTRVVESVLTLISYALLGILTWQSAQLALLLIPGVLLGLPLGHRLIRRLPALTFRRVCISFDAWLVGFGLSWLLAQRGLAPAALTFQILVITIAIDAVLLRRFFRNARPSGAAASGAASTVALRAGSDVRRPISRPGFAQLEPGAAPRPD
jgi:hypothetical protein